MDYKRVFRVAQYTTAGYGVGVVVAVLFGVAAGNISTGASQAVIFAGLPQLMFSALGFGMGLGESN